MLPFINLINPMEGVITAVSVQVKNVTALKLDIVTKNDVTANVAFSFFFKEFSRRVAL